LRLDEDGELLYSRIDTLIRGVETRDGNASKTWVCLINKRCNEEMPLAKEDKGFYYVRVDDMREDTWKKMFRKFTLSNYQ
jgi:hypothetical protein